MEIKQLTGKDAELYKAIRLEMIDKHPDAFGGTVEELELLDLSILGMHMEHDLVFGAFDGEDMIATAACNLNDSPKIWHMATLYCVYVREGHQGQGVTSRLFKTIFEALPGYVEQIKLSVAANNEPAINAYEKLGFERYGTEPRVIKWQDRYYDLILMMKMLDK